MKLLKKIFGDGSDEDEMTVGVGSNDTDMDESDDSAPGQLALDVYQTKDNVIIKSTIAGVKPEDLDITIADDRVTIKGERKNEEQISGDDYFLQECYWGGFYRSFDLPVEVDVDKSQADVKDGILTIILPKAARSRTKKVKVKSMID